MRFFTIVLAAFAAVAMSAPRDMATIIAANQDTTAVTTANSAAFPNDNNFINQALRSHNVARGRHGVPNLVWDNGLANFALRWANNCNAPAAHSGGPHGENLLTAWIPKNNKYEYPSYSVVFNSWYAEELKKYNFARPGFYHETGHFTQVVWKNTKKVGCAWTTANCLANKKTQRVYKMVCEYEPRGNIEGNNHQWFRENVFPPRK